MTDHSRDSQSSTAAVTDASTTEDASEGGGSLGLDPVFSALGHPRRRYLLYTLVENGNEATLTDLATKLAAWEEDIPVANVSDAQRDHMYVSLYHAHVPHLRASGIVDYKEGNDEILVRAQHTDQVQAVLDRTGASDDARQERHARKS